MTGFYSVALFLVGLTSVARAEQFDFIDLDKADTGSIGGYIVRYLVSSSTQCITVQTAIPGSGRDWAKGEKICSLEGKINFDDYTSVQVVNGSFVDGKLYFDIRVIPRQPIIEEQKRCEVIFEGARADRLLCRNE